MSREPVVGEDGIGSLIEALVTVEGNVDALLDQSGMEGGLDRRKKKAVTRNGPKKNDGG